MQRLIFYKKRQSRHLQIKLANERAGRKTNRRTLEAIENNTTWIKYYETMLAKRRKLELELA
jgi:hypothetical protein